MILDDTLSTGTHDSSILSERSLGKDWDKPEEDTAWSHLQRPQ